MAHVTRLDLARVRENAARVREEIAAAARRAGRDPGDVELLTAVKYVDVEDIGVLVEAGLTLFGENRASSSRRRSRRGPTRPCAGTSSASSRAARSSRSCRWSS